MYARGVHSTSAIIGLAFVALEMLVLFLAPDLLVTLAFVPLPLERRMGLPRPKLGPARDPAYRDAALTRTAHVLPRVAFRRIDLDDAVLVTSRRGTSFALRRAYRAFQRRVFYLVRIDLTIEGDELVLRVKQAIIPMTFPLAAAGIAIGRNGDLVVVGAMLGGVVVGLALQWFFVASARDQAIAQAFDTLEGEVRATFPKKRKSAKKLEAASADVEEASTTSP